MIREIYSPFFYALNLSRDSELAQQHFRPRLVANQAQLARKLEQLARNSELSQMLFGKVAQQH